MSIQLDYPGFPQGTAEAQISALYRYLTRTAGQLNYALSFLSLPETARAEKTAQAAEDRVARLDPNSTDAQLPSARSVVRYAAPLTRRVNGLPLTEDIELKPADLGAAPETRTVNGKALTGAVVLTPEDLGAEAVANRVSAVTAAADHLTYPTAKAVYDFSAAADRVTETGAAPAGNGTWRWRKWKSGLTELWGCGVPAGLDDAVWAEYAPGGLYTAAATLDLPFELPAGGAAVFVSPGGGGGFSVLSARLSGPSAVVFEALAEEHALPGAGTAVNVIIILN